MKLLFKLVSILGLLLTVIPALLVSLGLLDWSSHARWMALGMVLWFSTAPFWIKSGS